MAAPTRKTNWFAIWTSFIVVVIVAGVAVAVVTANNAANRTYEFTASQPDAETGIVSVGTGKTEVATYIDFMCPLCNQFEGAYGNQLKDLAEKNDITLQFRPVALLDGASANNSKYSTRSANAFYCVAETNSKAVVPFMDLLFKNQPREGSEGLTDEQLVKYAKEAGADIASCQKDLKWGEQVKKYTEAMPNGPTGQKGTPTIEVAGKYTDLNSIYQEKDYFKSRFGADAKSSNK